MFCKRQKQLTKLESIMSDIADDVKTLLGQVATMQGTLTAISQSVNSANETVASQPNNNDVAVITAGLNAVQLQLTNGFAALQTAIQNVANALVPTAGLATTVDPVASASVSATPAATPAETTAATSTSN
jgi:hypothetical protein